MTLWFVSTIMIAIAAVIVSSPFVRRLERTRLRSSGELAVFRDQLRELENEAAQGLIDKTQAENASIEIKRRILSTDRAEIPASMPFSRQERRFAVIAVTAIVIFGSIGLYAIVGSPDLPAAATKRAGAQPVVVQSPIGMSTLAPGTSAAGQPDAVAALEARASQITDQTQAGLPPVEEMIQRLLKRLQGNAQDPEGWRLLGWSYFNIDRYNDAANAYSKAIELRPASAEFRSARGEALIRDANGRVTPEARQDLEAAVKLDPKDARTRFYIGLAKQQAGDRTAALSDWTGLLADANPNEPWLPDLKRHVADLRRDLLGEGATLPPAAGMSDNSSVDSRRVDKSDPPAVEPAVRGPRVEDIRNADNMSAEDRTAMIRGMVDGLARRLDQSPRDADGWARLIRSRIVLGDTDQARKSLQRALSLFTEDGPERTRIVEAARQAGLTP
ncbi:c-type cytochrome biogenesis protein CcmI [Bradyrhizobium sp.]|uniref:c-type cytochrome biogenesis protein CcmI n=1 Tax=Bradyrhizobium sp. TaxID=376 RepID=UPI003C76A1D6